jgi:hypothetical protein
MEIIAEAVVAFSLFYRNLEQDSLLAEYPP